MALFNNFNDIEQYAVRILIIFKKALADAENVGVRRRIRIYLKYIYIKDVRRYSLIKAVPAKTGTAGLY